MITRWCGLDNIRFSIDEIRNFKGFEGLTDKQASEFADFLAMYAIMVYENLSEYGRN